MKNLKYIVVIILAQTLLVSCEDFIDNPPEDKIAVDDYFTTTNDVANYVKKYYSGLPKHGSASLPLRDENSDNLIRVTPHSVLDGSRSPDNGRWTGSWSNIRSVNILFDNVDRVTDNFESYKKYIGEAHFFRAWFYYSLLKTYGDLPIYDTELFPGDEALLDPRSPRTEVADFILEDLDKAIEYLDLRSKAGNRRLNKEAALAFKTRVALFEGTWQKYHAGTAFGTAGANPSKYFQVAVDAAEELMTGSYTKGIYNTGNPDSDYYDLFGKDNMSSVNEVLMYGEASSAENLGHELQFYTTRRTNDMALTWSFVTSFLDKSGQPYDYLTTAASNKGNAFLTKIATDCDTRLKSTVWIPGDLRVASSGLLFDKPALTGGSALSCVTGFQVKKYSNPDSSAAGADFGKNSQTGYILFRYAEVLLNYAEAKNELDGSVASEELNELRTRVGMPDFAVIPQANYGTNLLDYGYSVSDALYAIRNERRVELSLEGLRTEDYKRWAAHNLFQNKRPLGYPFETSEFSGYNPSIDANGLLSPFASSLPNGYEYREGQDYLNSIPADELVLNPNLLPQNPGW